jgi:predicted RNA binding protein YcfA (HicA-like mRNA interferase family)
VTDAPRDFSGQDIVKALTSLNYRKDRQRGSHVILKYTNPDTGEVRTVTVPMHDRIKIGTLQSIAEQCGAANFHKWCHWIDDLR